MLDLVENRHIENLEKYSLFNIKLYNKNYSIIDMQYITDNYVFKSPLEISSIFGVIKISNTYFILYLETKSIGGKFFSDSPFIPFDFYYKLMDYNIKIFNEKIDIKIIERGYIINKILK